MNVNLDQETIGKLVGGAVLQAISVEQRDAILQDAVKTLLTPERNSYGSMTPIQRAFTYAVEGIARSMVEKQLAEDGEFAKQINAVIQEGIAKSLMGEGRQKLVDKIAEAVKDSFGSRY